MRVFVMYCGNVSIRVDFWQNLPWRHFEAMNSSDKASGSELWEEHFESLLALVKEYIYTRDMGGEKI